MINCNHDNYNKFLWKPIDNQFWFISDCYDYFLKGNSRNGVYKVRPYGTNRLVQVYCDMKNGGWTLIQKRQDGTTNFFRAWEDYKEGFGGTL